MMRIAVECELFIPKVWAAAVGPRDPKPLPTPTAKFRVRPSEPSLGPLPLIKTRDG